jgi:hypothetical protein
MHDNCLKLEGTGDKLSYLSHPGEYDKNIVFAPTY